MSSPYVARAKALKPNTLPLPKPSRGAVMTYSGERFAKRHIGPSSSDELEMLHMLGYQDIEAFISDVIPANIQIAKKLYR
jgi:hypothetical protein